MIEDDHCGDISLAEDVSIGQFLRTAACTYAVTPNRTDRICVSPRSVERPRSSTRWWPAHARPGWTSRLLQAVLLDLLTHADPQESVRQARIAYTRRGTLLREKPRTAESRRAR